MRRLALAGLLLVAGLAGPAAAQYYGGGGGGGYGGGGGGGYGGGGGGGYDRPPPDYRRPPPDYDRRPPPPRYGEPRYGRRGSSVCVTSRGNCPIGAIVPLNAPCGCEVPGFGYKRGAAG